MQINFNIKSLKFFLILTLSTLLFSIVLFVILKQIQILFFGLLMAFLFIAMLLNIFTGHKYIIVIMYIFIAVSFVVFALVLTVIENNDSLKIVLMKISLISGIIGVLILFVEGFFVIKRIITNSLQ